jgi:hypothetical protein
MYAAAGGSVVTALGDTLMVAAGSAAANATFIIEIEPLDSAPPGVLTLSRAYRIGPSGMTFDPPATMVFQYTAADLAAGLDPAALVVMVFDENTNTWIPVGGTVSPGAMTVTVTLDHLSEYALFDCATGLTNFDGDALSDACDTDDDNDSCSDVEEQGPDEAFGGLRNPLNPWDFFDVTADGLVDFSDSLDVLSYFGDAGAAATPGDLRDRDVGGPNGWNLVESNTGVDFTDVLNTLLSFGHSCGG